MYRVWLTFMVFPVHREPRGPFPLAPGPSIFPWSPCGQESIINDVSDTANTWTCDTCIAPSRVYPVTRHTCVTGLCGSHCSSSRGRCAPRHKRRSATRRPSRLATPPHCRPWSGRARINYEAPSNNTMSSKTSKPELFRSNQTKEQNI